MLRYLLSTSLLIASSALAGCAAYATPGRAADLRAVGYAPAEARQSQTDPGLQPSFDKKPLATFPAAIAVVRLQAPGYTSETAEGWGTGKFSIVTTRDVESDASVERLARMPQVAGLAPVNRMLLPSNLESDTDLRKAAASLHADLLLVYTFDTAFYQKDTAAPLTVLTLGIAPDTQTKVVTTASAVLLDTRNGYVYGVAEGTDTQEGLANAWGSDAQIDAARRKAESAAFDKLVGQIETMWAGVLREHYAGYPKPAA